MFIDTLIIKITKKAREVALISKYANDIPDSICRQDGKRYFCRLSWVKIQR